MYSPLLISSSLSLILLLYPVTPTVAEESDQVGYRTPYETIYYYQEDTSAPAVPQKHDEKSLSLSKETLNSMVYRVKTILGMYTQDLNFGIRIYRTHDELEEFFR